MSNINNPYQQNPYAAPTTELDPMRPSNELRLADLGKRFLGALIDGFVSIPFVIPGLILLFVGMSMSDPGAETPELNGTAILGIVLMVIGALIVMGIQLYLLYTRSQSIGKYFMKTQIVNFQTGQRASFVSCFLLRSLVNGIIGAVPYIGSIYGIVNILFIFRSDRRCIHDHIAGTTVIDIA